MALFSCIFFEFCSYKKSGFASRRSFARELCSVLFARELRSVLFIGDFVSRFSICELCSDLFTCEPCSWFSMRELCSAPFGRGFLLGPSQKGISSGSFAPEHSLVSSAPFYSLVRSTPSYSRHSPPFFAPCRHRSGHIPPCVPHFTRCSTASALRAVTFLCPLHNGPRAGQSVAIGTSNCTII